MLEFRNLAVTIQSKKILGTFDLTLNAPRIAILGNNGSGKTTLARCAVGLLNPSKGRVLINGIDIKAQRKTLWQEINLCFQVPDHQIVMPTVKEELSFALKNAGKSLPSKELALILTELECQADTPCHQLSSGKKRLLCLHSLLLLQPHTLILDEPTAFLDIPSARSFMLRLQKLPQRIIMITHQMTHINDFDEAVLLHNGTIEAQDTPSAVIAKYAAQCPEDTEL